MSDGPRKLSPEELNRITQEFLEERSRARAAVFARAGFGGGLAPPAPATPSEDLLVQGILARTDAGEPTTQDERSFLRRKLNAMRSPDAAEPIPASLLALSPMDRLKLEARLAVISHAAGEAAF